MFTVDTDYDDNKGDSLTINLDDMMFNIQHDENGLTFQISDGSHPHGWITFSHEDAPAMVVNVIQFLQSLTSKY